MRSDQLTPDIREWLVAHGWAPGRDLGARAEELVQVRVRDSARQECPLRPVPAAVHVIRSFGLLTLKHPTVQRCSWVMDPTVGYDGDARLIRELSSGLGTELFPVGYESSEYGILLVDEGERFFHLHHTGGYFLGGNTLDAFSRFLTGLPDPDAEDFFV
ncbi:SUKH-3 domain-containing protein [Streptomyces sp. NPDC092952]|uniref:SUKH-3 domain-containing protein n=1 Tax=Streptomyces sp. NPDC092952 TaxID=3366018 RepID=UPI003811B338